MNTCCLHLLLWHLYSVLLLWRPAVCRKLSWRAKGMMLLLRNIFKVDLYSFQWPHGVFSASESTYIHKYPLICKQERCSIGLELVRSLYRLGSECALQVPQSSRLETWHGDAGPTFWIPPGQGPVQGLEVGEVCLCTQARGTLRFRSFAAFLGSTVLSLGLSAIGPTTLQTSDLSIYWEESAFRCWSCVCFM